jgi:hypothetical protein
MLSSASVGFRVDALDISADPTYERIRRSTKTFVGRAPGTERYNAASDLRRRRRMGLEEMLTLRVSKGRGLVGPAAARTRRVREANQKGSARSVKPSETRG